jgi:hypothetical protein
MKIFTDKNELIQHARKFLMDERIHSLEKDVQHCLTYIDPLVYAPFPALLYCFSTIDLLGSLHCGHAKANDNNCYCQCRYHKKNTKNVCAGISSRSRRYMENLMGYSSENALLLQKIFRHKLVHLAQPNPTTLFNLKRIGWYYGHDKPEIHLKFIKLEQIEKFHVSRTKTLECDHVFCISIMDLVRDIRTSVEKPKDGYLNLLEISASLQKNYDNAISQIYG